MLWEHGYTDVQERLVLTKDVAKYLWNRAEGLLKDENYPEEDKEFLMDSGALFHNVASVYYYQGEYVRGLEYYGKALSIRERVLGTEHPDTGATYNNMVGVSRAQGDYEKALEYYGKVLAIEEKVLGPEHPLTATTYNSMAVVYYKRGDFKNSLKYFEKALAVRKMKLGINHSNTQNTMKWIDKTKTEEHTISEMYKYRV